MQSPVMSFELSFEQLSEMISNIPDYLSYTEEEKKVLPKVADLKQAILAAMNRYTSHGMKHTNRKIFYNISAMEFDVFARQYNIEDDTVPRFWRCEYHDHKAKKISITKRKHENIHTDWPWVTQYETNKLNKIRKYRLTINWIKILYNINFEELNVSWNYHVEQLIYNPWDKLTEWERVY